MSDSASSARVAAAEADPGSDPARSPLLRTLLKLPLKKLAIWGALFGLLVLLSDFFPLILMTFILSYIATTVVAKVEDRFSARWIPVVIFFALVVAGVVGFFWVAVPKATGEVKEIRAEVAKHQHWNKYLDDKLRDSLGTQTYDDLNEQLGAPLHETTIADIETATRSLSVGILGRVTPDQKKEAVSRLGAFGAAVWKGIVYVFLTIVFSLMLVWGLPNFQQGLRRLETSRFSDVYNEVAPSLAQFGRLLGRAFEAQTIIAACNTLITFTGMSLIHIPGAFLLSVVVFLCSFIPVAGVFISTTPIGLVALFMQGGGFKSLLAVLAMVTIAHIIEAYILNPRIYGHHMRMNPLAVLAILVIAEHTVGVWGLVVAIPFSTYVWRYVILGEAEEPLHKKPAPIVAAAAPPPGEKAPETPMAVSDRR
jgi:predicted PurR-regulated permease PerM